MPVSYLQLCHTDSQMKTPGTAKSGALPFGKVPQAVLSSTLTVKPHGATLHPGGLP